MPKPTERNALLVKHCETVPTDTIVVNGPEEDCDDWEVYITDRGITSIVTLSTDSLESFANSILGLVAIHRGA